MRKYLRRVFGSHGPAALALYIFDAVIVGVALVSLLVAFGAAVIGVGLLLAALIQRKAPSKYTFARIGLYIVVALAAVATNKIDFALAHGRAVTPDFVKVAV